MENKPAMADAMYVNGQSVLRSNKFFKTNVKTKIRKAFGSKVHKEDGSTVTHISTRWNKTQDEMKKKKKKKKNKNKSKMGSPIIVEDIVRECALMQVPAALRQTVVDKSVVSESHSLGSLGLGEKNKRHIKTNKAKITIVECISPSNQQENNYKSDSLISEQEESTLNETEEEMGEFKKHGLSMINKKDSIGNVETMEEDDEDEEEGGVGNSGKINLMDETTSAVNDKASFLFKASNLEEIENKRLPPRFYSMRNKVLAIVEPECQFCFHGKLRIRVLYGAVRIYGASFNSSKTQTPIEVYSPRAYNPIAIEAIESEIQDKCINSLWESLAKLSADRKFANRLQTDIKNLEDGWAVVELENFENQLTNFVTSYCPHHLFPRVEDPSIVSWRDLRRAEIVLQANLRFADSCKQLTISSRGIDDFADGICYDWDTKADSRTVIAGGKGVGKSTTVRYLVNKLLAKSKAVLVLDLDPGQAEFTLAGCISLNIVEEPLLGPSFTHLKTPHYQLYVGSPDVTRCFTQYIDGVKKLVDRMLDDSKLTHLPIVINTMGFCKGIGFDIISYVIKLVSPTDVVQILSRRLKNNFDDELNRRVIDRQSLGWMTWIKDMINRDKPAKHRLHVIYSQAETGAGTAESWNLEAHQQRELVLLSYLSQIVENDAFRFGLLQKTSMPNINAVAPYVVPFSAVSVSLAGAFIPQVLSVMNGNVVALCGVNTEIDSTEESNNYENFAASYPRVLIRPPLSTCYGFGILRGIDMEKEQLFLNTPLTPEVMQYVNCLVGCVNLPLSLLHPNQHGAPYTGSEYELPTSRGSRRGYYRMRYQTDT